MEVIVFHDDYMDEKKTSSRCHEYIKSLYKERFDNKACDFVLTQNGKPFIPDSEGFNFSISHTYGMSVIAISEQHVGIDIEKITNINQSVVDKFYSSAEKKEINKCDGISRKEKTVEIWTRKEAVCKRTGEGITRKTLSFDTSSQKALFLKTYKIENFIISVCAKEKEKVSFMQI